MTDRQCNHCGEFSRDNDWRSYLDRPATNTTPAGYVEFCPRCHDDAGYIEGHACETCKEAFSADGIDECNPCFAKKAAREGELYAHYEGEDVGFEVMGVARGLSKRIRWIRGDAEQAVLKRDLIALPTPIALVVLNHLDELGAVE